MTALWHPSGSEHTPYSPQSRAERLIATGRLALAAFALLAMWLDPSEPTKYTQISYALLDAYAVYALLLALLVWRADTPLIGLRPVTHACDVLIFTLLMYLTGDLSSAVFLYFIFALLCATLYWQWRGTLWTTVVALTAFLGLGVYAGQVLHDATFALRRFMIHSVSLAVVAAFLGYLSIYQQRLYNVMVKLVSWSPVVLPDAQALVHDLLQHAADMLSAPRVLMIWEEPEEPWRHLALWSHSTFRWSRESPTTFEPLVAEPLVDTSFLCPAFRASASMVLYHSSTGLQHWSGMPLHPDLYTRFVPGAVLALRLRSACVQGWLLCFDASDMTADALLLGTIIAREVTTRLEQHYLLQRVQQAAAAERRSLAHNLHDSVLPLLTGAAMHVATTARLLEQEPQKVRQRLIEVEQLLTAEQHDLRCLMQALQLSPSPPCETVWALAPRLEGLSQRLECLWGLRVDMRLEGLDIALPDALTRGIYYIVHEALVNAARHADALVVCVELVVQDTAVRLTVCDNGHGFPFHGQYDLAALMALNLGPRMLRERVVSLGGTLALRSTASGAHLSITLPRARIGG